MAQRKGDSSQHTIISLLSMMLYSTQYIIIILNKKINYVFGCALLLDTKGQFIDFIVYMKCFEWNEK